ncbi:hypothetical protein DFH09DRAFT_982365 [Mycena vulgaris]|nr:hypothetical protein DFH09DRAFT_982365 [Mycena vulgaris]
MPAAIGAVPPRLGLIDSSAEPWSNFAAKLRALNASAADGTSYKLILFGRHGQGYHNVAEEKYGTKAWDDYWSKLNGDGELTWGRGSCHSRLTALGKDQAASVTKIWKEELAVQIPLPGQLYCSPMTRAIQTNEITFTGIATKRSVIVENCREEYGEHTCDKRSTLVHHRPRRYHQRLPAGA